MHILDLVDIKSCNAVNTTRNTVEFEIKYSNGGIDKLVSDKDTLVYLAEKFFEASQHIESEKENTDEN